MKERNEDEWNDSILSKPSDILCRNSLMSDNLSVDSISWSSNESFVKTCKHHSRCQCSRGNNSRSCTKLSRSYVIPISVMERNLRFDEPLLEDAFNEEIKTKLCSTRRRFPDDDNYESQSDLL